MPSTRTLTRLALPALLPALLVTTVPAGAAQAAPAGRASSYSFISQSNGKGTIARWNPCDGPITYRVNLARAPKNSLPEVKEAFKRIGAATGMTFSYAGTTTIMPQRDTGFPAAHKGADVVVAWATPGKESTMLPKGTTAAGQGGPAYLSAYTATGANAWKIFRGNVVLNAPVAKEMARGFTAKRNGTTGQLLMHEIGHAVGLGHAENDRKQIMFPQLGTKAAEWGAGDLTGLKRLGASAGCLFDSDPTKATVAVRSGGAETVHD